MSVAALVPVKALDAGKSRLVASLTRGQIERLSLAMLDDVVGCLLGVDAIDQVAVVTPDARVGERARELGALALVRDDPGLNPSLDGACSELAAAGADTLLVLLGDVAAARAEGTATPATSMGPSTARTQSGPPWGQGNNLQSWAPARWAVNISVGVWVPGILATFSSFAALLTASSTTGETRKLAPASTDCCACSTFMTVPVPTIKPSRREKS